MALIVKEIRVNTTIEKKVVEVSEISDTIYRKIEEGVIRKISQNSSGYTPKTSGRKKNER